ncbi:hypothetical protein [Streptomyces boluensis]|uniref:Uncharacterized protein n=1 Tax=Streptomyces boluensis TaxID=1775135 RepID=A0A964XPC8_9ACTN|nr:hypothetical protein [Streptomyces boluensis]NBE56425.1 hypothetical protein [Streptomyces boluensis]
MKWRSAAVTAAWAAVATVAGSLGAWTLAGFDSAPGDRSRPLDDAAVRRALASDPPPPTEPTSSAPHSTEPTAPPPSGTPASTPPARPARPATLRFTGGTATAECRADGSVRLLSWSPADGYHVEEYARGPAAMARLELEPTTDDADDLAYVFRCSASGRPAVERAPEDDD